MSDTTKHAKFRVRTTRPIPPPHAERQPIYTSRLVIRHVEPSDVPALFQLRSQPDVMKWLKGAPSGDLDTSLADTEAIIKEYMDPAKNYVVMICLLDENGIPGEVIGVGGVWFLETSLGYPAFGYYMRKEFWGKGYMTEAMQAWMSAYWALPREEVEVDVMNELLDEKEKSEEVLLAVERLIARRYLENAPSGRVLAKLGFQEVTIPDRIDGKHAVSCKLDKPSGEI